MAMMNWSIDNQRVLIWTSAISAHGQAADIVLGQSDMNTNTRNSGGISDTSLSNPYDVAATGSKLLVADNLNGRINIWNTIPTAHNTAADVVYGQIDHSKAGFQGEMTAKSLNQPVSVSTDGTKLFVADTTNGRVKIWNTIPTSAGPNVAADIAIGQTNLVATLPVGLASTRLNYPNAAVSNGTKLLVVDSVNSRVFIYNTIPTASNTAADLVLGQPTLSVNTINNGGLSASSLSLPRSIAISGTKLIVADTSNNRVLIWNSIPTANNTAADVVLGQPDMTSSTLNNGGVSAATLFLPRGVAVLGSKLVVADTNNSRVLIWNSICYIWTIKCDSSIQQHFWIEWVDRAGSESRHHS